MTLVNDIRETNAGLVDHSGSSFPIVSLRPCAARSRRLPPDLESLLRTGRNAPIAQGSFGSRFRLAPTFITARADDGARPTRSGLVSAHDTVLHPESGKQVVGSVSGVLLRRLCGSCKFTRAGDFHTRRGSAPSGHAGVALTLAVDADAAGRGRHRRPEQRRDPGQTSAEAATAWSISSTA